MFSHRGEGRLDLRISDAGSRRDLLRISPPDDLQFALAIHLGRQHALDVADPRGSPAGESFNRQGRCEQGLELPYLNCAIQASRRKGGAL